MLDPAMLISSLILAVSLGGLVVRTATKQRAANGPGSLTVRSIRRPREILRASRHFFAEGGWTISAKSATSATFIYELRPSRLLLGVLLLLGIIPGVIYLLVGKKTLSVTVSSDGDAGGSATVISWNAAACEPAGADFGLLIRSQEPGPRDHEPHRLARRRRRVA